MGLFDFFKKKGTEENSNAPASQNPLFSYISRYNEYIFSFINMQRKGNYAPIAAYEKLTGEIIGFLYLMNAGDPYILMADDVVKRMEERFEEQLNKDEIRSYTIFYHSQFYYDNNHQVANNDDELKAISIAYHFKNGPAGKIAMPYRIENDHFTYNSIDEFSKEENDSIFATKLKQGFNYFQHTEDVTAPEFLNPIGLKIKKSNNLDLENTWCGIFGFKTYRQPEGGDALEQCVKMALVDQMLDGFIKEITVAPLDFDDVSFNVIVENKKARSILPVVKTGYIVPVENKVISEWENVNDLEAIVAGSGKNTFGVHYFATDYAVNREQYLTQKKLNMKLSGIVFVLDKYQNKDDGDLKFADDFCGYFPSKDLPEYGCFDFIGILEDFKTTRLLHDNSLEAYILKVRLINQPEEKDFFTIDMYVNPENMRFKELVKGMHLTGMFQLQGQIA